MEWNLFIYFSRVISSRRIESMFFPFLFQVALLLLLWQIFLTTRAVEALYEAEISTNFLATLKLRRRIISLISSSFLIILFIWWNCWNRDSYLYRCMDNIKLISHNRLEDTDVQKRTRRRIKWKDSNDPSFPPDTLPSRKYGKLNIWPPHSILQHNRVTQNVFSSPALIFHHTCVFHCHFSSFQFLANRPNIIRRNLIHPNVQRLDINNRANLFNSNNFNLYLHFE